MSLCVQCGKVFEHAKGCASGQANEFDTSAQARNERALAALKEAQAALEAVKPLVESQARTAAVELFRVESLLLRHPSGDLTSFEHKRNYKATEETLKSLKNDVIAQLGDKGADIFSELAYAKRSLELLHAVQLRRREIQALKLDVLTQVPRLGFDPKESPDPTDPGALVKTACEAIEKHLASTTGVDFDVDQWGKSYIESLSLGEAPREFPTRFAPSLVIPQALIGTGILGLVLAGATYALQKNASLAAGIGALGAIDLVVAVVLLARALGARNRVPQVFDQVSMSFRVRLYLIAVNRSLRRFVSGLSQAEEALRAHTGGENAAKWKKIKTQDKDLVKALAGEGWSEGHTVDEEMSRRIGSSGLVAPDAIKSANGIPRDVWEGLGKAYFLDRREEGDSNEQWLASLSTAVLEQGGEREDVVSTRRSAIAAARSAFAGRATQRRSVANV